MYLAQVYSSRDALRQKRGCAKDYGEGKDAAGHKIRAGRTSGEL
jgi:hypothetical protein